MPRLFYGLSVSFHTSSFFSYFLSLHGTGWNFTFIQPGVKVFNVKKHLSHWGLIAPDFSAIGALVQG
jgi:hypothetical protein